MAAQVTSGGWLALLLIFTAAIGVVLLKFGAWPKRRGTERRCRRCNYVVENISSERCPECGSVLAGPGTVRGQLNRWARLWLPGAVLLVFAVGWGGHEAYERVDWYGHKPTRWVMDDLQARDGVTEERAWLELIRRQREGRLSKYWEEKMADVALADHWARAMMARFSGTSIVSQRGDESIAFLWDQYEAGKLTPAQTDLFFERLMVTRCQVRRVVLVGQDIPFSVEGERYVTQGWWVKFGVVGQENPSGYIGGSLTDQGIGKSGLLSGSARKVSGEQEVEIHTFAEFYRGQFVTFGGAAKPVRREQFTTRATLKVLDQATDEYLKVIDAPQLADQLKAAIEVEKFSCNSENYLDLSLRYNKVPVNLACDVFVGVGGKEYRVTQINMAKGSIGGSSIGMPAPDDFPRQLKAKKVDLIFRSSADLAARTVDMFEVWKGELIFKDVPVAGRN